MNATAIITTLISNLSLVITEIEVAEQPTFEKTTLERALRIVEGAASDIKGKLDIHDEEESETIETADVPVGAQAPVSPRANA